jgi:hypothetical protein
MSKRVTPLGILNEQFKWTRRPSSITVGKQASFLSCLVVFNQVAAGTSQ